MSNFLDLEPDEPQGHETEPAARPDLRQLLARVPIAAPPTRLHPQVSDRLAEVHGFASREPAPAPQEAVRTADVPAPVAPQVPPPTGRRLARGVPVEDSRQLSIRMPVSLYNDFLRFADEHKLTYNEAIRALLDRA